MRSDCHAAGPFSLKTPSFFARFGFQTKAVLRVAESALGLSTLNRVYADAMHSLDECGSSRFCDAALTALRISFRVATGNVSQIPKSGSLLVVANHPTGAAEGLVLESLIRKARPDVKVLSNHLLSRIPECRESSIFVDPLGSAGATPINASAMRKALSWLAGGHALIIFPAGEVAHRQPLRWHIDEPPWSHHVVRLARRAAASILCVYFEGRNSAFFQTMGWIHPRLRTALLPRELLRQQGTSLRVHIGHCFSHERLARIGQDRDAAAYLRLRTLILGLRKQQNADQLAARSLEKNPDRQVAVVSAQPKETIERQLSVLPNECLILKSGDFQAFAIKAHQAPAIVHEIGRLREITFRRVCEGTGREIDLDDFDSYYEHLFVYDASRGRIVGAYRLGFTEDIVPARGEAGLYTHSLFHYDRSLLNELGPSIELGRSFVVEEYQRSYAALLLLWKGIARMVVQRPRCRRLFGVVSVSEQYNSMTRQLLMSFLKANHLDARYASLIRPRTPPTVRPPRWVEAELPVRMNAGIELLDDFVQEIEQCQRNVPILLRQYLSLSAKVLGFNIDPAFGNVLDALMVVDLTQVHRPVLDRFFGREEAGGFLNHHQSENLTIS